jgi:1,4-dihydroxy-2-naphthoate octaprenyltransferase
VNFLSDYNDYEKGFDTPGALSSHTGVLTRELAAPRVILKAAVVCFCVTVLSGIYLIYASGWPVLIFGAIGVLGGASYTAGPLAVKYRGMGELLTSFLMGPLMVMGAYFVQTERLHIYPLLVSLCLGLLVGSVTLANNIRDMVDDKKNGFVTLPIRIGLISARRIYYCLLAAPYIVAAGLAALQPRFLPVLIVFITMPFAVKCINDIKNGGVNSAEIRRSAVKTPYPLNSIRLYTMFSLAMLAGLGLSFFAGMIFRYKII